jgi:hypothetical protein
MGPLVPLGVINSEWDFVIALLIGIIFGFSLEQAGFSSSRKLVGVFYGYDFVVLKVFFTAALTGMTGIFFLGQFGMLDLSLIYVNSFFVVPALVGGALIGLGFVTGGFCPGTAFTALAIGKIDAMVFIGGIFLGIFFYGETFEILWKDLFMMTPKGPLLINEILGISRGVFMLALIGIALLTFWATQKIQQRVSKHEKY